MSRGRKSGAWITDLDFHSRFINKAIITTQVKIDPGQIQPLCDTYISLGKFGGKNEKKYEYKIRYRAVDLKKIKAQHKNHEWISFSILLRSVAWKTESSEQLL